MITTLNRKKWTVAVVLLTLSISSSAQVLEWSDFRQQVLERHPVARQADLYRDLAAAALLRAKGGFDPKAYSDFYSKNFSGKTYFQYTDAGLCSIATLSFRKFAWVLLCSLISSAS